MDPEQLEQLLPGYIDALTHKMPVLDAQSDISKVQDVVTDLYNHLRNLQGTVMSDRADGYYHPSSIAAEYFCPFEAIQSRLGYPAVYNKRPESTCTLEMGHVIHTILQRYHKSIYGDRFEAEVPVQDEILHLKGTCDGVLLLEEPYKMVIEYKSINSATSLPKMGKAAHVLQAHCYEYMLGAGLGMVVYFCKSTNAIVGFPHTFDFQRFQTVVDRIIMLETCIRENRLPEPKPHAFCSECSAKDSCSYWLKKQRKYVNGG